MNLSHASSSGAASELGRVKVVPLHVEEPLSPLVVEHRYSTVRLVVMLSGQVLGHVQLSARSVISSEAQRRAIEASLGDVLWREALRLAFLRSSRGRVSATGASVELTVSVIVARERGIDELEACLESLRALDTAPLEIFVADEGDPDDGARRLCDRLSVYYRARAPGASSSRHAAILAATGDLVGFTRGSCVVDRAWLDRARITFADPLVMAATGYVGALELETEAQRATEPHYTDPGQLRRRVVEVTDSYPVTDVVVPDPGSNTLFRRQVFEELGLPAEARTPDASHRPASETYAFYRIVGAGYRLVFDPAQIVWRRLPSSEAEARRLVSHGASALSAYATRCLLHRELDAIPLWLSLLAHGASRGRGRPRSEALTLTTLRGALAGPSRALRTSWSSGVAEARPATRRAGEGRAVVGPEHPSLSVVIPSHNRRLHLARALEGFARQIYAPDRFEVVVVLDGSKDGSAELVRSLDVPYRLSVVEQDHQGVSVARNRGASEASEQLLVFLDDDIVPDEDFLAEHARVQQHAPPEHVACGYCPPFVPGDSLWECSLRAVWEDYYRRASEPDHQWTFMDFPSANVSMLRSRFLESGGFDERFTSRNEERELGVRMLRQGARLAFYRSARAEHHVDTRFTTELRHMREFARSDVLLACKHPEVMPQLALAAVAHPGSQGMSPRAYLVYRHRDASELLVRLACSALAPLEALKLRRHWRRLADGLLFQAYILGLRDALPRHEDFLELIAPLWDPDTREVVPVTLERIAPLRIGSRPGRVAVRLEHRGMPIMEVLATVPDRDWDWDALTERVLEEALGAVKNALELDDLLELARSEGDAA